MGKSFEQAALAELVPDGQGGALARDLLALVRKDLIRPDRSLLSAGDAYRFRHLLIRDAAYDALPKAERAELHARFGDWLERVSGDRLEEYEEIIGYHLEQAYSYHAELGLSDAASAALAQRAAKRLASAGRRALNISGSVAAITLLERALGLETEPSAGRAETLDRARRGHRPRRPPRRRAALHRRGSGLGFQLRERHHRGSGQGRPHERQLQLGSTWCVPRRQCRRGVCSRSTRDRRTASGGSQGLPTHRRHAL